jgi:hypothetical protein
VKVSLVKIALTSLSRCAQLLIVVVAPLYCAHNVAVKRRTGCELIHRALNSLVFAAAASVGASERFAVSGLVSAVEAARRKFGRTKDPWRCCEAFLITLASNDAGRKRCYSVISR